MDFSEDNKPTSQGHHEKGTELVMERIWQSDTYSPIILTWTSYFTFHRTTILAIRNYFHRTMAKVKKAHSSSEMKLNVQDAMLDKVIAESQRT